MRRKRAWELVGENQGRKKLESARVKVIYVTGLEEAILAVVAAGYNAETEKNAFLQQISRRMRIVHRTI